MKKIIFLILLPVHLFIYAQSRPFEKITRIFKPVFPEKTGVAPRPQTILTGLDSIEIKETLLNSLVKKMKFAYDNHGNVTLFEDVNYDLTGSITDGSRNELYYDAQNKLDSTISSIYNNGWTLDHKRNYHYNISGQIDSIIIYAYSGGHWDKEEKKIYFYNTSGSIDTILTRTWDGSQWADSYREIYTYDSQNRKIEMIVQDFDGSQWINTMRETYTYDSNGNLAEYIHYSYDSANGWNPHFKHQYTYNSNNSMIIDLGLEYDGTTWQNDSKEQYIFEANGDMSAQESYDYNPNNASWENDIKFTFNHDTNVPYDDLLLPFGEEGDLNGTFNHKVTDGAIYQGDNWSTHAGNMFFYYSNYDVMAVDAPKQDKIFAIYPNPVSEVLYIQGKETPDKIEIYSLTGKKILSLAHTNQMDVSQLHQGFYILRILRNNKPYVFKFCKK